MNQIILAKLKRWRAQKADLEKCELYRIFQNKTLEEIAILLPQDKESFLAIKGVGEKKFQKYGRDIFEIVSEGSNIDQQEVVNVEKNETLTVGAFLDNVNAKIYDTGIKIKGEVSSMSFKGHLYFSLKDKDDGSVLSCFMWARDYEMCGIQIVEGMELTIHGFPEIYKPTGKFTFRTSAIELVGEGALKKAYDELKKKLEDEGLFEELRKKIIPDFPVRIGLITSRDGAVINDFMSNIGRFGYHITFIDSRVEGIMAVKDLVNAVRFFKDKSIDVLVIIRGGGSLESLQAFNNEALIREVADLSFPVICGIGHDKDVPLLSYIADKAVSTPSIVAKEINSSWQRAVEKLDYHERFIVSKFEIILRDSKYKLENASINIKEFYQNIFNKFEKYQQTLKNFVVNVNQVIKLEKYKIKRFSEELMINFSEQISATKNKLIFFEKELNQNNPERQLKLGYSITLVNGKIVKSVNQISKDDILVSRFGDGKVSSKVQEIFNN